MELIDIYEAAKEAGIEIDSHCSDLYMPVNEKSIKLVNQYKYKTNVDIFISQIDGSRWYDVPFAYYPYYGNRSFPAHGEKFEKTEDQK